MMDGITILNTYTEYISGPGFSWWGLIVAVLFILCIAGTIFLCCEGEDPFPLPVLAIGCLVLSIMLFDTANKEYESYPVYDVTLDESVSLVEFNERYEIIEQNGMIYTIKNRTE